MFSELRAELLAHQQEEEARVPYVETVRETETHGGLNFPNISTDVQDDDADIFKRLDIPYRPTDEQEAMTGKVIDTDRENMQRALKQ